MNTKTPIALAVVAHPDDAAFMMAGALLLLKAAGADIHIWNLANGSLGTAKLGKAEIAALRWQETVEAARVAGATAHRPLFEDMAIFYDRPSLGRVAAGIRRIRPDIILTHPVVDGTEDHQNAARLAVSSAFSRGMKNMPTDPASLPVEGPVAVYHCLPAGLRAPDGTRPSPSHFVDIATVFEVKKEMLARHQSQKEWFEATAGAGSPEAAMEEMSREVGRMSGRFALAEGFSQRWPLGFSPPGWDPLAALLGERLHRASRDP